MDGGIQSELDGVVPIPALLGPIARAVRVVGGVWLSFWYPSTKGTRLSWHSAAVPCYNIFLLPPSL